MAEAAPKKLTGLQMPLDISTELAKIIGTKKGEQVSRPQVIKKLWAYLKEKNLQVGSLDTPCCNFVAFFSIMDGMML